MAKESKSLRVFQLMVGGEKETVAAYSAVNAINTYCKETGCELSELDDDSDVIEFPKEQWALIQVVNTEYNHENPEPDTKSVWTIAEMMDGLTEPSLLATTVD